SGSELARPSHINNRPKINVIGKPTANTFICGAERLITPNDMFTTNIEVNKGREITSAALNIQLPIPTMPIKLSAVSPDPDKGKVVKLSTNNCITTICPFILRNNKVDNNK